MEKVFPLVLCLHSIVDRLQHMCAQFHGLIDSITQFKLNLVNRLLGSCRLQMIIMQVNNWKKSRH